MCVALRPRAIALGSLAGAAIDEQSISSPSGDKQDCLQPWLSVPRGPGCPQFESHSTARIPEACVVGSAP